MTGSLLSNKRFLFKYLVAWVLFMTMHCIVVGRSGFDWHISLVDSVVSNVLLVAMGMMISNNTRFYRPQKGHYFYMLVYSLVMTGIWVAFVKWVLLLIYDQDGGYFIFLLKSLPVRFCISFLIIGWMFMINWMWYSQAEQRENETRKADAEKLAREAELFKLRQQLQPHFLFNSLNSVSALLATRPEEARHMIQQLSDFLRGTLKKEEHQEVSLAEELQHLQLYLDIEKVRFGHRLRTEVVTDETTSSKLLPPLMLQPVVENAIKFGLYDTTDDVTISIVAKMIDDYLVVIVENPFDPETSQPNKGTGFGLSSLKRRLFLLYGRQDLLETQVKENLFSTLIKIPQKND